MKAKTGRAVELLLLYVDQVMMWTSRCTRCSITSLMFFRIDAVRRDLNDVIGVLKTG